MYPIRYASRQMLDTEHRYSKSEKHALSLIFCVEKFKHYLIGRHFVIISNNGLAKQVLQSTHPLGRLAKWLAILQEYDFSFKIVKGGCYNLKNALIHLGENPKVNLLYAISIDDPWYGGIYNFLCTFSFPPGCTSYERNKIRRDSRRYTIFDGVLYRQGVDGVLRQAIDAEEASKVVKQYHDGFCGGHYAADYTAKKILHAGYYWPNLFKDVALHCKTCEFC